MKNSKTSCIIDTNKREVTDFKPMFERLEQKVLLGGLNDFFKLHGLDNTLELSQHFWAKKWVVYAKPSFGGNDGLVRYLAKNTHNIAIYYTHLLIPLSFSITKITKCYLLYPSITGASI